MNEMTVVYGVVIGAAAFLALRFMPTGLKARVGIGGGSACASDKATCGTKGCDGCH